MEPTPHRDLATVAFERPHARVRHCVPDLDGFVVGPRCELLAVRRECHRVDQVVMALEGLHARVPIQLHYGGDIIQLVCMASTACDMLR